MKDKIAKIIEDNIEVGDCSSCTKQACEEYFEGCYWDLSERRCQSIATKIVKLINLKQTKNNENTN